MRGALCDEAIQSLTLLLLHEELLKAKVKDWIASSALLPTPPAANTTTPEVSPCLTPNSRLQID